MCAFKLNVRPVVFALVVCESSLCVERFRGNCGKPAMRGGGRGAVRRVLKGWAWLIFRDRTR